MNSMLSQMPNDPGHIVVTGEPEERCAAQHRESGRPKKIVETPSVIRQTPGCIL